MLHWLRAVRLAAGTADAAFQSGQCAAVLLPEGGASARDCRAGDAGAPRVPGTQSGRDDRVDGPDERWPRILQLPILVYVYTL